MKPPICAGPARWPCFVGAGHCCGPDPVIDATPTSPGLVAQGAEVLTGLPGSAPTKSAR